MKDRNEPKSPFDVWYDEYYGTNGWYKNKRETLRRAWDSMEECNMRASVIEDTFDRIANAIRAQYGD